MTSIVKAFARQVKEARTPAGPNAPDFFRVWIQGVVVACAAERAQFDIDDGTAVITVDMNTFLQTTLPGLAAVPRVGELVMVIGPPQRRSGPRQDGQDQADATLITVIAHQVVVVSDHEQQESLWSLEVIEYWTSAIA